MELNQPGLLDELLALRRDNWSGFPTSGFNEFFPTSCWSLDSFQENLVLSSSSNPSSLVGGFSTPTEPPTLFECPFNEESSYTSFAVPDFESSSYNNNNNNVNDDTTTPPIMPIQQDYYPSIMLEDEELGLAVGSDDIYLHQSLEERRNHGTCKVEIEEATTTTSTKMPVFNMGTAVCGERKKSAAKKLEGQPSKNLMAERRRRKRLNDRLSMLRSIVPKISKMDRTSILADTIDYMKELLERINKLQEEEIELGSTDQNQMKYLMSIFKEITPNEVLTRNSPKFDVERRNTDTRIEICCPTRPGLLLSTVNTLEALGLEIQQCVISCFNDFAMQASCSEALEQRKIMSSEDIKQAIFRNAGYGGRCL